MSGEVREWRNARMCPYCGSSWGSCAHTIAELAGHDQHAYSFGLGIVQERDRILGLVREEMIGAEKHGDTAASSALRKVMSRIDAA